MQRVSNRISPIIKKASVTNRPPTELTLRIFSATLLIALSLIMTLTSLEAFGLMIGLFTLVIAWEWGRLIRGKGFDLAFAIHAGALAAACYFAVMRCPACAIFAVLVGTTAVFLVRLLRDARPQAWWSAAGVYYNGFPAVGLIWLRADTDYGALAVLYIFAIVWTTDSAAYLFGRWIGGPKLAPRISPKKTWAGFIGALISAGFVAALFGLIAEIFSPWLVLLAVALAVIAQLGDLGESAIKRTFGYKDSSALIPGHGGVMDRLDGLIFAATAAALLAWFYDPASPGRALLLWS